MKNALILIMTLSSFSIFGLAFEFGYNGYNAKVSATNPTVYDLKSIRVIKGGGMLKRCKDKGEIVMNVIKDRPGEVGDACPEVLKMMKKEVFKVSGDTLVITSMAGNCMGEVNGHSYKCMVDNI